ncbi:uncharacterized protein [Haliotis asinina]|uniref:uncharacterized protein n=1 Tax=Haliotis asinina TaxID=109174 RepID=UPI003531C014
MKRVFVSRLNSPTRRVTQPSPLVSLGFVETSLSDLTSACSHCTQTFSAIASKTFLRTNSTTVLSSLDSRFYWCNFCHFSADSKDAIVDHVIKQHRFGCKWCSFQSFCRASVLRHSFDKHQPQMNAAATMCALCSFVEDRCSVCTHGQLTSNNGNNDCQTSALIPRNVQDTTLLRALQLAGPAEEQVPLGRVDEETHAAVKPAEELKHFIVHNTDPVFVEAESSSESLGGSYGDGKQEDSIEEVTYQNMLRQELESEYENFVSMRHDSGQLDSTSERKQNEETDNLLNKHKMSTDTQYRKTNTTKPDNLEPGSRTQDLKLTGNMKAACYKETTFPHTDSGTTTPKRFTVTLSNSAIRHASHHATENLSYIFKHVGKLHKNKGGENLNSKFSNAHAVKESAYVVLNFPEVSEQLICTDEGGVPVTTKDERLSVASCSETQEVESREDVPVESSLTDRASGKERQAVWTNLGTEISEVPQNDGQSAHVPRAAGNLPGVGSSVTSVIKMKMTETIGSAENSGFFSSYLDENRKHSRKDSITQYPDMPLDTTERSGSTIPSAASVPLDLDSSYYKPKDSIIPADQCLEGVGSKLSPCLSSVKAARTQSSVKANQCPALIAQLLEAPSVKQHVTNMAQGPGQIQEVAPFESETTRSRLSRDDDSLKKSSRMKDVQLGLIRKQSSEIVIKALNDQESFVRTSSECWKDLETDQVMAHQQTQSDGNEKRITLFKTRNLSELLPERSPGSHHQCPTTCHSKNVISKASPLSRNSRSVDMGRICFDQVSSGRTYFQHSRNLGEVVKRLHKKNRETYEKVASACKELSTGSKKRKITKKK